MLFVGFSSSLRFFFIRFCYRHRIWLLNWILKKCGQYALYAIGLQHWYVARFVFVVKTNSTASQTPRIKRTKEGLMVKMWFRFKMHQNMVNALNHHSIVCSHNEQQSHNVTDQINVQGQAFSYRSVGWAHVICDDRLISTRFSSWCDVDFLFSNRGLSIELSLTSTNARVLITDALSAQIRNKWDF